jgi:hypothetical protein
MTRTLIFATIMLATSGAAQATSMVKFVYTGDANIEFVMPKSPVPTLTIPGLARFNNVSVTYNGVTGPYTVFIETNPGPIVNGGLRLFDLTLNSNTFAGSGPQIFSGSPTAPTFITGSYSLSAYFRGAPGTGQLVISNVGGAIPEPASWAMLLSGFGLTGIAMRRRAAVAG